MNLFNNFKKRFLNTEVETQSAKFMDISLMCSEDKIFLKKTLESSKGDVDSSSSGLAYLFRMALQGRSQKMNSETYSHMVSVLEFMVKEKIMDRDNEDHLSQEKVKHIFSEILESIKNEQ